MTKATADTRGRVRRSGKAGHQEVLPRAGVSNSLLCDVCVSQVGDDKATVRQRHGIPPTAIVSLDEG